MLVDDTRHNIRHGRRHFFLLDCRHAGTGTAISDNFCGRVRDIVPGCDLGELVKELRFTVALSLGIALSVIAWRFFKTVSVFLP